ncbi:MAG: hypothetical protein ACFB5Z_13390 [Elainellaceae cyanobacterium]
MSFSKSVLSSSVLAGAVFCAVTAPLVALKSDAVTVQLGDEPVFVGQIKDVAVPYVGLAMAVSLSVGAVHLSSLRWRQSSSKLSEAQDEVTRLRQQLQEQVLRVDAVQFSEDKLATAGLTPFVEAAKPQPVQEVAAPGHQGSLPPSGAPKMPTVTRTTMSSMPAAQAFQGFSTSAPAAPTSSALDALPQAQPAQAPPLEDLMSQLREVMAQVEKLQTQDMNAPVHHIA